MFTVQFMTVDLDWQAIQFDSKVGMIKTTEGTVGIFAAFMADKRVIV